MLTEREFSRRARLPRADVAAHRGIPRIACSVGVGPAYPAFMLSANGLRLDVAFVALFLRRRVTDLEACDWLVRRNPDLNGLTPLVWIGLLYPLDRVIDCLPPPTRTVPGSDPTFDVRAMREEWLRYRGEAMTPGLTIPWERLERSTAATPPGI